MTETKTQSQMNKIDFAVIISVKKANPNGDPLNGNRPRQTYDGFGEISDVCLKRKIRNRLQDMGESIFVQSDDNRTDDFRSLRARFNNEPFVKDYFKQQKEKKEKGKAPDTETPIIDLRTESCKKWFDVRSFGQVFPFSNNDKSKKGKKEQSEDAGDSDDNGSMSIGIRGPVTIQSAFSIEPITPDSLQITKSVNLEPNKNEPDKKGPDTMGMKHRVDKGIYVTYGAINTQLASKTGFSDEDAGKIKNALQTLFVNDASSARPEGSMEVLKVIWWKHNSPSGQYSSAKVHNSLREVLKPDGSFDKNALSEALPRLETEMLDEMIDTI
jgi:CRISPR-associated protein Csd2